jgi:O2-independent ubiquinone biosynthesis accessory factor UbiT
MRRAFFDRTIGFDPLLTLALLAAWPLEQRLTRSVRKLAERRPHLFSRLGGFRTAVYVLSPNELPVAFRLVPNGAGAEVTLVPAKTPGPYLVRISGPLATLVGLFDGSCDADSSFFSRAVVVDGATAAALALHNTLEAAELKPSDIFGLVSPVGDAFDILISLLPSKPAHA